MSVSAPEGSRSGRARLSAAFAVAVLLLAGSAAAEDAGTGDGGADGPPNWAYQMAHDLMSPYCPGRTLSACPSPQAAELRQWILFQAASGRTRADIEASLHEQFGDDIRGAPKAEGWGLSAYVVPVLGFLFGGALVAYLLRRLASTTADVEREEVALPIGRVATAVGPTLSDAELERIVDEDLAQL